MAKVTRVAYSKNMNQGKFEQLSEMAHLLGEIRTEVWNKYGSMAGVGLSHRTVRNQWLAEGRAFKVMARIWKQTLSDVMGDIKACRDAAKVKVRRAIWQRTKGDKSERRRLFTLLKSDKWTEDSYLRRMMRKYYRRGHTSVDNQIVLDTQCYKAFSHNGRCWIDVTGLMPRERIAIPLNTTYAPTGTLRLILREGRVEVHYAVDEELATSTRPSGHKKLGVDKGYTEAFTDSEGDVHGKELGELLSKESDFLKVKYQRRNKLRAIARKHQRKNPRKAARIRANNLGRKKLNRRKKKHTQRVRDKIYKATHSVVDKAKTIAAEDLTSPIKGRSYGKNQNRRLSGWVKGVMAEALTAVTTRRGSALHLVNCAYTSQIDSRYNILLGERKGDRFYCFDGVVLQADQNAASTIVDRMGDKEITLYMPYKEVKKILVARTKKWMVLNSSKTPVTAGRHLAIS